MQAGIRVGKNFSTAALTNRHRLFTLTSLRMKFFPVRRLWVLPVLFALLGGLAGRAENLAPSNPPVASSEVKSPDAQTQDLVRAYLQIQEQLHATQLALERNRQEAEAAAGSNALAFGERLDSLQKSFSEQRAAERKTFYQLAGLVAGAAFFTVLLAAWFQARALKRVGEAALAWPAHPSPMLPGGGDPRLLGNGAVEASARLAATIERLEKRIQELETSPATAPALATPGSEVAALLAKGQALLQQGEAAAAAECFDEALALNPQHTEVLIKKGAALEKMAKLEEALASYDRAIAADRSLTIAYLHKGGVYNRLERYNEALACYEQALRTQETGAAT